MSVDKRIWHQLKWTYICGHTEGMKFSWTKYSGSKRGACKEAGGQKTLL